MKNRKVLELLVGTLLIMIVVWAGLMGQTQETTYLVFLREKAISSL